MKFIKIINKVDINFIKDSFDYTIINENKQNLLLEFLDILKVIDNNENIVLISDSNIHLSITLNVGMVHIIFSDNINYLDTSNIKNLVIVSSDNIYDHNENIEYPIKKINNIISDYTKSDVHLIIDDSFIENNMELINNMKNTKIKLLEIINIKNNKNNKSINNILVNLLNLKEKKINIFNEHSEIIIYRNEEITSEEDIGWYILRGLNEELKDMLFDRLKNNKIISITLNDIPILISKTNLDYQNKITYFDNNTKIEDLVLFPEEKKALCFELIN